MNRRTFGKALAAGTVLAPMGCARQPGRPVDVLVLGAGLAGLAAAKKLQAAGRETLILEARKRVGGRAHTDLGLPDRPEYGAIEVGDSYTRVHALAARYGLAIDPPDRRWFSRVALHVNGHTFAAERWAESGANLLAAAERAIPPYRLESHYLQRANPLATVAGWDDVGWLGEDRSITQVLREQGVSEEALRLINVAGNHNHSDDVSALGAWRSAVARRQDRGSGHFVAGAGALASAMAGELTGQPRLGSVVAAIGQEEDGVRVQLDNGTAFRARHCICTLPVPALRALRLDLPLTTDQREALATVPYTRVTMALFDAEPFWEEDGLAPFMWTDTPLERLFPRVHRETGACIGLKAFINGRGADSVDALGEQEFERMAVATIERIRPAARGRVRYLRRYSWGADRFAGGAYAAWSPGRVARQRRAVRLRVGRVLFAGEHTAIDAPGMEGAIRSGERAAERLMETSVTGSPLRRSTVAAADTRRHVVRNELRDFPRVSRRTPSWRVA
ncbi:MAG: NAD(P)/FAD-dependent oxidoreductase [Gammaproteobacteria bacterium]|nr:NAD(P)/FAD-dependent oxidoreductase [Gammaproteobacteria bacterium]